MRATYTVTLIITAWGPCTAYAGERGTAPTMRAVTKGVALGAAATPEAIYHKARHSVVMITTPAGQGSGVVMKTIDSGSQFATTWIATNAHVVGTAEKVNVEFGGVKLDGIVAVSDTSWDISLIRLDMTDLPAMAIAEATPARVGNKVFALGAPRGLSASFSEGIVSALRTIAGNTVIQTTAPISPGSSGGALLDASGKLVGITTFKINGGEGLNFAIDVKLAQRLLEAEIAAMSIRLTVEPADRRRLGNPFVKWLATSYAKDGRSTMAQYEEYSHNYNARKITIEQAKALMFEVASQFVADVPFESSPQAPQTPRMVTLTCQLGNGTSQQYGIDFTASTVNGWSAQITEATVAFSYTNTTNTLTNGIIDRVNGTISLSAGRPLGSGACTMLKGDAF